MKYSTLDRSVVTQCTNEIVRALFYLRATKNLLKSNTLHGIDFIRLAHWALHDQMISHAIRVLYSGKNDKNFWHLIKIQTPNINLLRCDHEMAICTIKVVGEKLRLIRDKVHFHIDEVGVKNSANIWDQADLRWLTLECTLEETLRILLKLHIEILGDEFVVPHYDGGDALVIAEHAARNELLFTDPNSRLIKDLLL